MVRVIPSCVLASTSPSRTSQIDEKNKTICILYGAYVYGYMSCQLKIYIVCHATFQNKRKIPTDPPERISRITNTHPKHPDSPFYGPNPIKPLATLTLTKIKEVCGSDEGSQSVDDVVPSTEDLVNIMKKKMMLTKKLGMVFLLHFLLLLFHNFV